jgi:hypothetical protein
MSHSVCQEPDTEPLSPPPADKAPPRQAERLPAAGVEPSYECINQCVSSLGVTSLLSGAAVSLGCLAVPAACPAFVGVSVGGILGGCEAACEDLESKP